MTDEEERRAWIRGYRAALDDLKALGRGRIADWYDGVIEDMRGDLQEIDNAGKRRHQLVKLRQKQKEARAKPHRPRVKLLLD